MGSAVSEDDAFLGEDAEALALVGYNSALTPLKEKAKKQAKNAKRGKKRRSKYSISLPWKRRLKKRQSKEVEEMAKFVALNNGCWHICKETYLFTGKFERPPPYAQIRRCRTRCPICTGDWFKVHLPVYRSSVVEFFTSTLGSNSLPCRIGDGPSLSRRIKGSPYWVEKIFDRASSGIKMTHVDALILSLTAARILEVQKVNDHFRWNVRRNNPYNADAGVANYLSDDNWKGVNLHNENRVRKRKAELLLNKRNNPSQVAEEKGDSGCSSEEDSDEDSD